MYISPCGIFLLYCGDVMIWFDVAVSGILAWLRFHLWGPFHVMGISIFPYLGDSLLLNCGKSTNRAYVGVDFNPTIRCCCGVPHCCCGAIRDPEYSGTLIVRSFLFFKIVPFLWLYSDMYWSKLDHLLNMIRAEHYDCYDRITFVFWVPLHSRPLDMWFVMLV